MATLSLNVEKARSTADGSIPVRIKITSKNTKAYICTGEGAMTMQGGGNLNADYKQAYEAAMLQIEALNRIIKQLSYKSL